MKINRITYSLGKNVLHDEQLKEVNQLTSFYEELLFNYLSKNTKLGGFGFLHITLITGNKQLSIKTYGQIIKAIPSVSSEMLDIFFTSAVKDKIAFLSEQLRSVLSTIKNQMNVDIVPFEEAIRHANANYSGFEQVLSVSKTHKSRKVRVNIIRCVHPKIESILYRIRNKNGDLLNEQVLLHNSSVYDVSYEFKKSKWSENELKIYNRFQKETFSINIQNYIHNST